MRLRNNDSTRDAILTRYFPQYRLIAPQAHSGLGGASCILEQGAHRLVLRHNHDPFAPGVGQDQLLRNSQRRTGAWQLDIDPGVGFQHIA